MNESESSDDYEPAVNAEEEDSDSDGPTPAKVVRRSGRARGRARVRAAPRERTALRGRAALRGRGRGRRARVDPETIVPDPGWRKTADADPPTVAAFTFTFPTTPLPANTPLISFFCQIFVDDFFNHLAAATNENAATKAPPAAGVAGAEVDANVTSDRRWHATNSEEMKAFIAINIIMGIKDLSEYVDYWSTDPILHDPFVANTMPRRRYEKLCQFMHCSIAADEDRADKLVPTRCALSSLCVSATSMPALHLARTCLLTRLWCSLMAGFLGSSICPRSRSNGGSSYGASATQPPVTASPSWCTSARRRAMSLPRTISATA